MVFISAARKKAHTALFATGTSRASDPNRLAYSLDTFLPRVSSMFSLFPDSKRELKRICTWMDENITTSAFFGPVQKSTQVHCRGGRVFSNLDPTLPTWLPLTPNAYLPCIRSDLAVTQKRRELCTMYILSQYVSTVLRPPWRSFILRM